LERELVSGKMVSNGGEEIGKAWEFERGRMCAADVLSCSWTSGKDRRKPQPELRNESPDRKLC